MPAQPTDLAEKIIASNLEVHRREAGIYDSIHPEIFGSFEQKQTTADLELIASHLSPGTPVRALDIGCGTGNLTLKYLRRGYQVRAVDLSPEMMARLRSKLTDADLTRIEMMVTDAAKAVTDRATYGTFDIISFSSVLHHLPDYNLVLQHALKQLRPGGLLWVCHEPLVCPPPSALPARKFAAACIDFMDAGYIYAHKFVAYLRQAVRTGTIARRIDYSWSDFHAIKGIDPNAVLAYLENQGGRTLLKRNYKSRFAPWLAALDARFALSPPSQFRFIMQRLA